MFLSNDDNTLIWGNLIVYNIAEPNSEDPKAPFINYFTAFLIVLGHSDETF